MMNILIKLILIVASFNIAYGILLQKGIGEPCSNRTFWSQVKLLSKHLKDATNFNAAPMTPWNQASYLQFNLTGDRTSSDNMMVARYRPAMNALVFAECVFNNGTYMNKIEEYLNSLCDQPSWALTQHDSLTKYTYLSGSSYFIELNSAEMAAVIGQTYFMLGHKLKNETKQKIKTTVNTRIFEPMRLMFANKYVLLASSWYKIGSNWNAVCWSGVTIAALTLLDDEAERQTFLNNLLANGKYYWDSFADDGYPSEGVGYFNYGVAPYIATRQIVMEATGGQTDMFGIDPRIPQNAISCIEYPMSSVVMAHFGDDKFTVSFDSGAIDYILSAFDKKNSAYFNYSYVTATFMGEIIGYTVKYAPNYRYKYQTPVDISYGMNKYYNISGIMVSRPSSTPTSNGLAATIKLLGFRSDGGHSHNDAGSYSIALNGVNVAGEIGGPEFYTGDTFSNKRYSFMVMNSYGHPVPRINGKNQSINYLLKTKPVVLSQSTSSNLDKIVYDLKNCYEEAPEIKNLTRTMIYNRLPAQNVIIEDEASFNSSSDFEVAITSKGDWVQTSVSADKKTVQGTLTYSNQILKVTITGTDPISIDEVAYTEFGNSFTRVAVKTANQVTDAKITATFNA